MECKLSDDMSLQTVQNSANKLTFNMLVLVLFADLVEQVQHKFLFLSLSLVVHLPSSFCWSLTVYFHFSGLLSWLARGLCDLMLGYQTQIQKLFNFYKRWALLVRNSLRRQYSCSKVIKLSYQFFICQVMPFLDLEIKFA